MFFKKAISFRLGYVSKSIIFVLCFLFVCLFFVFFVFFKARGDTIRSIACQCLDDQKIGRTI